MPSYAAKLPPLDPCPIEFVAAIIGGRWKARILYQLSLAPTSLGELGRSIPRAKPQVVASQVRALERDGIVLRLPPIDGERWGRFDLTEEGRGLCVALDKLAVWGREAIGGWSPPPAAAERHSARSASCAATESGQTTVAVNDTQWPERMALQPETPERWSEAQR